MLTFRKDINDEVGHIIGGDLDGKYMYINNSKTPKTVEYVKIMQENNNVCEYCQKKCSRKDHLKEHQRICKQKLISDTIKKQMDLLDPENQKDMKYISEGKELLLTDNGMFYMTPPNYRLTWYIFGPPSSGKSYLIGKYIKEYASKYKKRPVYLFSFIKNDNAFKDVKKHIKRVSLDDSLVSDPITLEELRGKTGCLCIFDDIIEGGDSDIEKSLMDLINNIIRNGRDHEDKGKEIDIIFTCHTGCNGHKSKLILSCATHISFYPSSGTTSEIYYLLKQYMGLAKKSDTDKIMKLPSRYVTMCLRNPRYAQHEKGIIIL